MAATAVERRGVSVALACRAFGVSETCYRYSPLLSDENEQIADLLTGLTDARKTWVRIPEYPASHSDNIRPPKPGYPATLV